MRKLRYMKYDAGGDLRGNTQLALLGAASQFADALDTPNEYGNQSPTTNLIKNAGNYATIGSTIAPGIGTGIGALVGVGMGLLQNKRIKREEANIRTANQMADTQRYQSMSAARVAADPSLVQGTGYEYYAGGGQLKPLNSETVEVEGPSHEKGGVKLPEYGAEVEGNETIHLGYVFSDRLGFADRHKRIARAIGKIEAKPRSPERVNSLNRLIRQQDELKLEQEVVKNLFR